MNLIKLFISPDLQESNDNKLKDALDVFRWQVTKDDQVIESSVRDANYIICSYNLYEADYFNLRTINAFEKRFYIVFKNDEEFLKSIKKLKPKKKYQWSWKEDDVDKRYEVTSRGDKRYSPFFMKMEAPDDHRIITLEDYYQLYLKGYINKGYTSGFEVKGLPPLNPDLLPGSAHRLFGDYLFKHQGLFYELALIGKTHVFTDMFDKDGGQNKTYANILNRYYGL